jgi:hypothetical protein
MEPKQLEGCRDESYGRCALDEPPETCEPNSFMDRVLIDFVDFPNLKRAANPFLRVLKRRFELVLSDWPDFSFSPTKGNGTNSTRAQDLLHAGALYSQLEALRLRNIVRQVK